MKPDPRWRPHKQRIAPGPTLHDLVKGSNAFQRSAGWVSKNVIEPLQHRLDHPSVGISHVKFGVGFPDTMIVGEIYSWSKLPIVHVADFQHSLLIIRVR